MFRSLSSLALLLWTLPTAAQDESMLRVLTEAAADNGAGWVTTSGLVVGLPLHPERPGTRPLEAHAPVVLPAEFTGWKPIGLECKGPLSISVDGGTLSIEVLQAEPIPSSLVAHEVAGAPRVMAALPIGVTPCEALIADLGPTPGNELAAAWRIGDTFGVTVWALPLKTASP